MHAINWFEIPATDLERSRRFYATILNKELEVVDSRDNACIVLFPADEERGDVGGCISDNDARTLGGTRVYLNVEGQLDSVIERVQAAGGEVIQPRTSVAPHGFIAIIKDSEGNVVGLHSRS